MGAGIFRAGGSRLNGRPGEGVFSEREVSFYEQAGYPEYVLGSLIPGAW
jgi:hypothetical protein